MTEVDVIQGRSFLQLPLNNKKVDVDSPHIDTDDKHFVMLYYVCDSDGDTIIYNEKVEIFNVEKLHQGKNDSDETMEFLYVDINPDTKVEL